MDKGYKTTEFWLGLAAMLLGVVYASGAVTNEHALQLMGIAASVLGSLGYTVARTVAKKSAAESAAVVEAVKKQ